jgi:hypothetical protein
MTNATPRCGPTDTPGDGTTRGLVRARLLQARVGAERAWADWCDETAQTLLTLPPAARLRELRALQDDLTAPAWYRVAESLLAAGADGASTAAVGPDPDRSASPIRGLPWDRRARSQVAHAAVHRPQAGRRSLAPAPASSGSPASGVTGVHYAGPCAVTARPEDAGAPPGAFRRPVLSVDAPPPPTSLTPSRDSEPDFLLGLLVLVGAVLGVYWLFSRGLT